MSLLSAIHTKSFLLGVVGISLSITYIVSQGTLEGYGNHDTISVRDYGNCLLFSQKGQGCDNVTALKSSYFIAR